MSTPIVESIGAFIETAIGEITVVNGFNYTLTASRAKRHFLEDEVLDDLNAYIIQGKTESKGEVLGATDARVVKKEYMIWVVALQSDTATEVIDTKLNQIGADVEKKLCTDPTCGGYAKHLDIVNVEPTDTPETGVLVTIEVTYSVVWNDPYTEK